MLFQRFLVRFDKMISKAFNLEEWRIGEEKGNYECIYLIDVGPTIGVVDADGNIRSMMGYWSVSHKYDGQKLLERIPVRKDLQPEERLATRQEINQYRYQG